MSVTTTGNITCPHCRTRHEEEMPTNACMFFYECPACKKLLRPEGEDCCVFCSYGDTPCPPKQADPDCRQSCS